MEPAAPKRRLSGAGRRKQLIEVGLQTFAELGYEGTTVEEVARRAKITKPLIYEHFGGKDGLYRVIVEQEAGYVTNIISEVIASGSPRTRIAAAALAFLEYVRDHPAGFAVLAHDAPASRSYASMLSEIADRIGRIFTNDFMEAGIDTGVANIYAHALIGMVTFVGQWWAEDQSVSIEEVASHITTMAWVGLENLPQPPQSR